MSGPQKVVMGAWLAMIGLATARSFGGGKGLPQPNTYLSSAILFTILFGAAGVVGPLAAIFAVGVDVAALVLPYYGPAAVKAGQLPPGNAPVTGTGPLDTIAAALNKMSGGIAPAPGGTVTP